jgi:hypothetical protein
MPPHRGAIGRRPAVSRETSAMLSRTAPADDLSICDLQQGRTGWMRAKTSRDAGHRMAKSCPCHGRVSIDAIPPASPAIFRSTGKGLDSPKPFVESIVVYIY